MQMQCKVTISLQLKIFQTSQWNFQFRSICQHLPASNSRRCWQCWCWIKLCSSCSQFRQSQFLHRLAPASISLQWICCCSTVLFTVTFLQSPTTFPRRSLTPAQVPVDHSYTRIGTSVSMHHPKSFTSSSTLRLRFYWFLLALKPALQLLLSIPTLDCLNSFSKMPLQQPLKSLSVSQIPTSPHQVT